MKNSKLIQIIVITLLSLSCQKNTDTSGQLASNLESSSLSATSCQPSGVSISNAQIVGTENIVADQKAVLSLDRSVNCTQSEKAVWSISNLSLGTGPQVETVIQGTGIYYINVSAATNERSASQVNSKALVTSVSSNSVQVAVTDSAVLLLGPQVGVEFNSYDFSLLSPSGTTLKSASWNFGDGSPIENSTTTVSHSFSVGSHPILVEVIDQDNKSQILNHTITILPLTSGVDCSSDEFGALQITGPTQVPVGTSFNYSLNQPACLQNTIAKVSWNFGDSANTVSTVEAQHTYTVSGDYTISLSIWLGSQQQSPDFTITRQVNVVGSMTTTPGPVTPVDPNSCLTVGDLRTVDGLLSNKDITCGLNGTRNNSYRDQITQICKASQTGSSALTWVEQSRTQILVTEGACQNQSCDLETNLGHQVMANGETRQLYSTNLPVNSCASVQESRTCNNGVISGSVTSKYVSCQNGCGDFGVSGTVKVGVVIGQIKAPVACAFNEVGVTDTLNQLSDKTCQDGQIISSNTRSGDVTSKGLCPVYHWQGTDTYTSCSADCGGVQNRHFECRNDQGVLSDTNRCTEKAPVEQRVCDGNLEAVRKTTSTTVSEEASSSNICPKNQIGVIVKDRSVTTSVTVACIDHKIQQESVTETATPWITNSYCRDYVAMRCSHDSLSNSEAAGRYKWMMKCQDEVPAIKEFLTKFDDVKVSGRDLNDSTRHLYPTFLNSVTNKYWIAPKIESGSCEVPTTVYVAAVCVSSCATPEQEIIAQVQNEKELRPISFIEALTKKLARVGTLQTNSTIKSTALEKTAVDQWVTELLDTTQPILTFRMKSGGQLKVTLNHPLLAENGSMKTASDFKVNESLTLLGGRHDQIISIDQSDYYGKVYNVFVKSNDLKKNVVVINNYLSGTAFYQNDGAKDMNRQLFRNNLTRGVFEK